MNAADLVLVAGTAGGVAGMTMIVTTTVVRKLHSDWTAEGRAQALEKLFLKVEARHQRFVNELLPMLDPEHHNDPEFQNVGKHTKLLRTYDHPLISPVPALILTPPQSGDPEGQYSRGSILLRSPTLVSLI